MSRKNWKISTKQLKWLIILDCIGRAVLLLPRFTGNESGRSFILSLILGALLLLFYVVLISSLGEYIQNDFPAYIQNRLGEKAAFVINIIYLVYIFVELIYVTRMFSSVIDAFFLSERSYVVSMVMLLLGGCYLAVGGIEVQGRVAGILYKIIIYPLLLILLKAAFALNPDYLSGGMAKINIQTVRHGFQMLIPFGSIGLFLFLVPYVKDKKNFNSTFRSMTGIMTVSIVSLFLILIGTFGENGMRALPWPAITLLCSESMIGGFFRRWDVIFTGLLLLSFFLVAGIRLFYMQFLEGELLFRKRGNWYLPVSAIAVLAAAVWVGNYETAVRIYTIINGYMLLPLIAAFTFLLRYIEWIKRRKER